MVRVTYLGLQTSLEGVPQTQFFLTGKNLPGPSKKFSEQPKEAESVTPEQDPPTNGEEEVKP
tara:strand:+ start:294 stop:479 length:186 start_codon:yes stop_codon:yes gene_type:complete